MTGKFVYGIACSPRVAQVIRADRQHDSVFHPPLLIDPRLQGGEVFYSISEWAKRLLEQNKFDSEPPAVGNGHNPQNDKTMTNLEAIGIAKQFRKDADDLLQRMKAHTDALLSQTRNSSDFTSSVLSASEVIAQHIISTRDLESCIMRQGMALKYIGNPDPYPQSRNPESPVVEPTADGLKL